MAIFSPLRSRRFAARQAEVTQQLIAFRLRHEWFALSIHAVQKVVSMGNVYGDPRRTGVSLSLYQGQELLVVDVAQRIFGMVSVQDLEAKSLDARDPQNQTDSPQQRYLMIVQSTGGDIVGLPIDSLPVLRRVPESSVTSLPTAYLSEGNIQCVSSMMVQVGDQPPLFLLNPDQLIQPQQIVPC
jgi:purine-binding chemotaxis protein CheW